MSGTKTVREESESEPFIGHTAEGIEAARLIGNDLIEEHDLNLEAQMCIATALFTDAIGRAKEKYGPRFTADAFRLYKRIILRDQDPKTEKEFITALAYGGLHAIGTMGVREKKGEGED